MFPQVPMPVLYQRLCREPTSVIMSFLCYIAKSYTQKETHSRNSLPYFYGNCLLSQTTSMLCMLYNTICVISPYQIHCVFAKTCMYVIYLSRINLDFSIRNLVTLQLLGKAADSVLSVHIYISPNGNSG